MYRVQEKHEGLRVNRVPDKYKGTRAYRVQQNMKNYVCTGGGGFAVAQLVEALRYKPEGRRFDYRH